MDHHGIKITESPDTNSEIETTAIRTPSFVRSIIPLGNGQGLRLTTAKYFTPAGVSIHEVGVSPQVEVVMSPEEDERLSRQRARSDITDRRAHV